MSNTGGTNEMKENYSERVDIRVSEMQCTAQRENKEE